MAATPPVDEEAPNALGCSIALLIGPVVAFGTALLHSILIRRPFDWGAEAYVLSFEALMVAAPFLLIAMTGTRYKLAWLTAFTLTFAFWGYLLFDGVRYHWSGDTSGADIGLGLIMLASPIVITAATMGIYAWERSRQRR